MARSTRTAWQAALQKVAAEVAEKFPNDTRTAQIEAAVATAAMAIDNLHDLPAYVLPTT